MFHSFFPFMAGISLLAALTYWVQFCTRDNPGLAGAGIKAGSTGLLALLLWMAVPDHPDLWPVALGMTLGALGDWFLARRGEAAFLAGMAAFGAGHLAYAAGMLDRSVQLGFDGLSPGEGLAAGVLTLLVASTPIWLLPRAGRLRGPVGAYVVLIGALGAAALMIPAYQGQALFRLGSALFILSDLLLALRLFVVRQAGAKDLLSRLLWPAYWAGQALIGSAALWYWQRPV